MKYLIVQDWQSTHGNHAGMVHMCKLLKDKWPDEFEVLVKPSPKSSKPITGWWLKRKIIGKYRYYKGIYYKKHTCLNNYISLCQSMFAKLQEGDEVFLLEYLLPDEPQYGLAKYIRKNYPFVRIYALSHLTKSYFEQSIIKKDPNIVYEWSKPIDVMLTLGSSLTEYFIEKKVSEKKISTGFHYVDSDYYNVSSKSLTKGERLTVISMGMMQRDYSLLVDVVRKCNDVNWIICRGLKKVDDLFTGIPNVELKGFLPENELRSLMANADLSLNIMEDTVGSNVITTSMAMGLGLIVTDVGSIRDYCDESNAFFCKNETKSIVDAINYLSLHKHEVAAMKQNSLIHSNKLRIENIYKWFNELKTIGIN